MANARSQKELDLQKLDAALNSLYRNAVLYAEPPRNLFDALAPFPQPQHCGFHFQEPAGMSEQEPSQVHPEALLPLQAAACSPSGT